MVVLNLDEATGLNIRQDSGALEDGEATIYKQLGYLNDFVEHTEPPPPTHIAL